MYRMVYGLLVCAFTLASFGSCAGDAHAEDSVVQRRILLITGEDYPGHKWQETAPVLKSQIAKDTRLQVDVLDDLTQLGEKDLSGYAAVVLHFKNYDPKVPGRAGLDNLIRFVEGGGGVVLAHFACGAFEEFKGDFAKLAGRVWFGAKPPSGRAQHDRRGPFSVHIADEDHPVTAGMEDFEITDELYTCLEGETPIDVLATGTSQRDGKVYPLAFATSCGDGRVFHCVLGHDVVAFGSDGAGLLFRRGTAWAAGLAP